MTHAEQKVAQHLEKQGWRILKTGWPDFLCMRNRDVMAVEVKAGGDKVQANQLETHKILECAGIRVFVYRCDGERFIAKRSCDVYEPKEAIRGRVMDSCRNCGHDWFRQTKNVPRQCPLCGTRNWAGRAA